MGDNKDTKSQLDEMLQELDNLNETLDKIEEKEKENQNG